MFNNNLPDFLVVALTLNPQIALPSVAVDRQFDVDSNYLPGIPATPKVFALYIYNFITPFRQQKSK